MKLTEEERRARRTDYLRAWRKRNREMRMAYKKTWRKENADRHKEYQRSYISKYRKTLKGFLSATYTNMQQRVRGRVPNSPQYTGLPIMTREEFYEWALIDPEYLRLFEEWTNANYEFKLAPSVDRIDNEGGYTLDNVQWLTQSENSGKRGSR